MINRLREYDPPRHVPPVADATKKLHLDQAVKLMATTIARHPAAALAAALLVGASLGWLLKRR